MSDVNFFAQSLTALQSLPSELRRNLHLIYDLDTSITLRKQQLFELSEKHCTALQHKIGNNYKQNTLHNNNDTKQSTDTTDIKSDIVQSSTVNDSSVLNSTQQSNNIQIPDTYTDWITVDTIEAQLISESNEIKKLTAKRTQYALDCYTIIDSYVKKLDLNIRKYENKIRKTQTYDITAAPVDRRRMIQNTNIQHSTETRELIYVLQNMYKNELERYNTQNIQLNQANEPVYCFCKRVSFGQMLGCDSMEQCVGGEWYHMSCLGIDVKPRGKWYCDACKKKFAKEKAEKEKDSKSTTSTDTVTNTINSSHTTPHSKVKAETKSDDSVKDNKESTGKKKKQKLEK